MDETVMNKRKKQKEQRKKQESTLPPFFFLHASFFICILLCICSCDTQSSSQTGSHKSFVYHLWGTWESNQTEMSPVLYSGTLKIDSDTITIDGYGEEWVSLVVDDSKRPFRDFPKGVPLKGYSQDNKIYIEFPTSMQTEFPYSLTETDVYPNKVILLGFTFGERPETLKRKDDN